MRLEIAREILTRANAEPIGLCIRTNMVHALNNQLSVFRKDLGFDNLMFCIPSIPDHLFIVHKSMELEV